MTLRWRELGPPAASILIAGCAFGTDGEIPANLADTVDEAPASDASRAVAVDDRWFVELEEPPLARGGKPARLAAEKARFHEGAAIARIAVEERHRFERLWNGLSLRVDPRSAARLATLPGVKAIYPVVPIVLDKADPGAASLQKAPGSLGSADLEGALAMTGVDVAQSGLGLTGAGVRVGVIDSGIDIHHPDLGGSPAGCFGSGCRVAFGHDFVGDDFDAGTTGKTPVPDAIPDDCGGHGTHVAGIIGGSGALKGVAPGVTFGAYRVFGCAGSTSADLMIAAMERAYSDGMRVINMSIGSPFQWPEYPTAKAADQLVSDGVVVVCSIGNSGTSGVWAAGAPGVGEKVIGTASFENTAITQPAFTLSPDDAKVGFDTAAGAPAQPISGSFPVARTGSVTSPSDACTALPDGSLTGAVALIRRGGCAFYTKAANAEAAGAAAVIVYNNQAGTLSATVAPPTGSPPVAIPVVTIGSAEGALLDSRLDAGPLTMTWGVESVSQPNAAGGTVSSFSSHGLAADLSFKPDLGAPGGAIFSTYPLELGGYASLNGTSMAAPHVAGAVALLLEARPDVTAGAVRDLLQNTALPAPWPGDPAAVVRDVVHHQGAGLLQIDAAIQSLVTARPAKLALGESQAGPSHVTITLTNAGAAAITYDVSHLPAASTTGTYWATSPSADGASPADVVFSAPSLTVPASGQASLDVTITASPALGQGSLYGGYLVLAPQGGGTRLRVPYAGFAGDYQALPVLTATSKGYPWLATRAPNGTYTNHPIGKTFTLAPGDVPYVVMHLDRPAAKLRIEVRDAVKGKPYGTVIDLDHVGQASSTTGVISFAWDGTTVFNKKIYAVPNGTYVLVVSALKALGDPDAPGDWESWTSPVVTLNHP